MSRHARGPGRSRRAPLPPCPGRRVPRRGRLRGHRPTPGRGGDPEQAFQGLFNPAPITVAALYMLARAVSKSWAVQPVVMTALARLSFPVVAASAFVNNTRIVATVVSNVTDCADRNRHSPSRYLMPLSFAAILGGMMMLIGPSTNLVTSGLLEAGGRPPLLMFELTKVGLPIAVAGVLLIVPLAPVVLPDRKPPRVQATAVARGFTVQMSVIPGGPRWQARGGSWTPSPPRSLSGGDGASR